MGGPVAAREGFVAKRGNNTGEGSLFDGGSNGNGNGRGKGSRSGRGRLAGEEGFGGLGLVEPIALHTATQARYLNYALSVITSRALPDVRDGLKPVQRRILYTMWRERLAHPAKHRKCAGIVGSTMRDFHPHGDSAIYEALVRMAQPWVMREKLVDGSGNFGSLDDDPAAAMRYTEARLAPIASELLGEIGQGTVPWRGNYDGTSEEPVVLPSRVPNLLLNGSQGIAVGMATNIPPHNLGEVCNALLKLLDDPEIKDYQLVANDAVRGPDFPTGGQIITSKDELREIYRTGSGGIKIRATWSKGETGRASKTLYITSVPYGANKAAIVEQIAGIVLGRKMPLLLDVKDVSADDVRIELTVKKDADDQMVMAYLFKHTGLQTNFGVNLTCLIPQEDNPFVGKPSRLGLKEILWHFLHFRLDVVTKRLAHELAALERKIHELEGFAFAFDILDDLIRIIRASEGKADAAQKILKKYGLAPDGPRKGKDGLDAEQVDAILELKLYRLARLEINLIKEDLAQKEKRAKEIRKLLDEESGKGRWQIVREEIEELSRKYGKTEWGRRKTLLETPGDEPEYNAEDFIVAEDNHVLVTMDGWIKRQREINLTSTRLREGDEVLALEHGSTKNTIVFFSNFGTAYTMRIIDVPATTGYGEPIQKFFKLKDGERIIAALSMDPRSIGDVAEDPKKPDLCPTTHALAVTSDGFALRFGLGSFADPSTRSGRKYARPSGSAEVIFCDAVGGKEVVIAASRERRAILTRGEEVNYLGGPGKGVMLIKLDKSDRLIGATTASDDRDSLTVKTSMGGEQRINTAKYKAVSRGGRGHEIMKRGQLIEVVREAPTQPVLLED